jgi:hypothetical protein
VSVPVFSDLINGPPSLGDFVDANGIVYGAGNMGGFSESDFGTPEMGDASTPNAIVDVNLQSGYSAINFDFSEKGLQPDAVSKRYCLASTLNDTTYWESTPVVVVAEPGTFVLLAAGAAWGGVLWRRRRARRRLATNENRAGITVGRARASPWWRSICGRRPRPANIGHVAELTTKSFFTVENLCNLSFKERVMKVVRIISLALALVVTAMVSQSRADMIIDLEAQLVVDSNGLDLNGTDGSYDSNNNYSGPVYSLSSDGKTVSFDSASVIPATGAWVQMEVYADVLDSAGSIAYWDSTYGAKSTSINVGGHAYAFPAPGNYDPNLTMTGTYKSGATTHSTTLNATSAPTVFTGVYPYAPLGVADATLRLYNSATSTGLAGTITAVPNSSFSAASTTGASIPAAQAGGIDLGPSNTTGSVTINGVTAPVTASDFFSESYNQAGNYNPASPGFSYLTSSGTVEISSSTYMQVPLGSVYFEITAGTAGKQAIIAATPEGNVNNNATLQWMESLTTTTGTACYGAGTGLNIGTYSANAPVTVSVSGNTTSPGAVGITAGPSVYSNLLINGISPVSFTLSNTSGNLLNGWILTPGATTGNLSLVTSTGSLAANGSTNATGTYTAPTVAISAVPITSANTVTATISGVVSASSSDTGANVYPSSGSATVNVGSAVAVQGVNIGTTQTWGPALYAQVQGNGTTYAGLASIVNTGSSASNALGTMAMIMSGSNNSTTTPAVVQMAWRTRAPDEMPGHGTQPPMSRANGAGYLISDVVQLSGLAQAAGGSTNQTDPYVLEMTFSSTALTGGVANNYNSGYLFLGTLASSGSWENAVEGNLAGSYSLTPNPANFVSWQTFQSNNSSKTLPQLLGSWGVDPTNDTAWAVVDYDNAQFAVVPESGTLVMLLVGTGGLAPAIRRRWKARKKT